MGAGLCFRWQETLPHTDAARMHMHVLASWRELAGGVGGLVTPPSHSCIPRYTLDSNAASRTRPHLDVRKRSLPVDNDESHKNESILRVVRGE